MYGTIGKFWIPCGSPQRLLSIWYDSKAYMCHISYFYKILCLNSIQKYMKTIGMPSSALAKQHLSPQCIKNNVTLPRSSSTRQSASDPQYMFHSTQNFIPINLLGRWRLFILIVRYNSSKALRMHSRPLKSLEHSNWPVQFDNPSFYRSSDWPVKFDCRILLEHSYWPNQFYSHTCFDKSYWLFQFDTPTFLKRSWWLIQSIVLPSSSNLIGLISLVVQPSLDVLAGSFI